MSKKLKKIDFVVEDLRGVCLWEMPDGTLIGDGDGRFLSLEGDLNSPIIESKMRDAAVGYVGMPALDGEPMWIPGSRKITDNEADDHTERFIDGYIPDPVDSVKQLARRGMV
jgi:hypothetical protein